MPLDDVGMCYSLTDMFHAFPEEKSKKKTWQSLARITNTAHIIGTCGNDWDSPPKVVGRRKQHYITTITTSMAGVRSGDALLTTCYVPCVPSSEEERNTTVVS